MRYVLVMMALFILLMLTGLSHADDPLNPAEQFQKMHEAIKKDRERQREHEREMYDIHQDGINRAFMIFEGCLNRCAMRGKSESECKFVDCDKERRLVLKMINMAQDYNSQPAHTSRGCFIDTVSE